MHLKHLLALAVVGWVVVAWLVREVARRVRRGYEYRWDSFAIRGLGGRQLFQIRRGEISALEPLTLGEDLFQRWSMRRLLRGSLARRVVIRSRMAHMKPVVISWEGRPIAGLVPRGMKARAGAPVLHAPEPGASHEVHPQPVDGVPPAGGGADVPVAGRGGGRGALP